MILGIDPGEARIGLALADEETRFARPLEVIDRRTTDPTERITTLIHEHDIRHIVIGRPVSLTGRAGPAVDRQQELLQALEHLGVAITEFDERFTTVVADQRLRAAGTSRKDAARVKDAVAAQVMLQDFLDAQEARER